MEEMWEVKECACVEVKGEGRAGKGYGRAGRVEV